LDLQEPSRLQRDLAPKIIDLLRAERIQPGDRIQEIDLARKLQVSRTPVRAVLEQLATKGVLQKRAAGGYSFSMSGLADITAPPLPSVDEMDQLCLRISADRVSNRLPSRVSEADLMRRYDVSRPFLLRVLSKLSEVGLTERQLGHGWAFSPKIDDAQGRLESYAFRQTIEPAGLLLPTFHLASEWICDMRRRHVAMLAAEWRETLSIPLFEMNAAFHEGLAAASGNSHFHNAVQQQNRLRRLANYDWSYGYDRVVASCTEHLEILDRLERDERDIAAALLRKHLERASTLARPDE
jgi:DNA-binding GntR family transcriptional regulator